MTSIFLESADPLAFHFLAEHQRRYERIKAWREAQSDPYFSEVTPQWRQEFERKEKKVEQCAPSPQSVDKFAQTASFPRKRESSRKM